MIEQMFLDLDDVLNTCTPAALNYVGCDINPTDYKAYPAEVDYDIVKAARYLGVKKTKKEFWDRLGFNFWAGIPKSSFCDWLIKKSAKLVGKENVFIATSPTKGPQCLAGKLEWLHRNAPKWLQRQYCITPRKWLLAKPGRLLIDDNWDNLKAFAENGGRGLFVPRPWGALKDEDPEAFLHEHLEKACK